MPIAVYAPNAVSKYQVVRKEHLGGTDVKEAILAKKDAFKALLLTVMCASMK